MQPYSSNRIRQGVSNIQYLQDTSAKLLLLWESSPHQHATLSLHTFNTDHHQHQVSFVFFFFFNIDLLTSACHIFSSLLALLFFFHYFCHIMQMMECHFRDLRGTSTIFLSHKQYCTIVFFLLTLWCPFICSVCFIFLWTMICFLSECAPDCKNSRDTELWSKLHD